MWLATVLITLTLVATPGDKADIADAVVRLTGCKDMRANVCLNAAATLTNAGDKGVRPTLTALRHMTRPGQILAMSVFEEAESAKGTAALSKVMLNRKLPGFIRALAVSSLGIRHGDRVTRVVIKGCSDPDPIVRAAAARSLGNRPHAGDKKVMKALIKAARDEDATVRIEALLGLGMSRNELGGEALTLALGDPEQPVRRVAADGLRFVEHSASVQPLIEGLNTRDAVMRRTCAEALVKQTGNDLGEDYALWREWYANR